MYNTKVIAYPIRAGGVLTRVLETGRSGPAVVFLHGVGARADRWTRNLDAIAAEGYRAYALDFPGHGFADKSADIPADVPQLVTFVLDCLAELGVEHASVVGTSLGGHVAASLASTAGSRVDSLALVGTLGVVPLTTEAQHAIAASVVTTSVEGISSKLRHVVHDADLVTGDWIAEEWHINNSPGAAEALKRFADYFEQTINDDVVPLPLDDRLTNALALIWGAEDPITPKAMAEETAQRLGVDITWIEHAAHAPYFEQPEIFNKVLLDRIGSNSAR